LEWRQPKKNFHSFLENGERKLMRIEIVGEKGKGIVVVGEVHFLI
jgi:hypothetical protein